MGLFGPSKKKVLVVDDDENVRTMLEMALSDAGYDVDTAATGIEGIKKLTTEAYDLAILDHNMPGATGIEILETISNSPYAKETRFIMLTAESQVKLIDRAYAFKAREYIVKPFEVATFLKKVQAVMAK